MAAKIGSLYVSMSADVQPFVDGMGRAEAVVTSSARNIERSAGVAEASVTNFSKSLGPNRLNPYGMVAVSRAFDNAADRASLLRGVLLSATGALGGFSGALSVNLMLRYADSFTKIQNGLAAVADSTQDAQVRFAMLNQVAASSRSSLEATSLLYTRIQKAAPEKAPQEILQYVETIQKALQMGGATAQESRSAAVQFSQAIASNRLGGEELRAILETPLGTELAKGLGVGVGELRRMGTEGELTADKVLGALKKIRQGVNDQFAKTAVTTDQALTVLDNKMIEYAGKVDAAYGITRALASGILALGNNLESIVPTLGAVAVGFAAIFAARNKALMGGIGGAAAGGLLGNMLGGTEGGILGAIAGGLAGMKLPDTLAKSKEEAKSLGEAFTEAAKKAANAKAEIEKIEQSRTKIMTGDSTQFASKEAIAAVETAKNRILKIDEQIAAVNATQAEKLKAVAQASANLNARDVKLAWEQAAAQMKVLDLKNQQAAVGQKMQDAALSQLGRGNAAGMATQDMAKLTREHNVLTQQINAEEAAAAKRSQDISRGKTQAQIADIGKYVDAIKESTSVALQQADLIDKRGQAMAGTRTGAPTASAPHALLNQSTTAVADLKREMESGGAVNKFRDSLAGVNEQAQKLPGSFSRAAASIVTTKDTLGDALFPKAPAATSTAPFLDSIKAQDAAKASSLQLDREALALSTQRGQAEARTAAASQAYNATTAAALADVAAQERSINAMKSQRLAIEDALIEKTNQARAANQTGGSQKQIQAELAAMQKEYDTIGKKIVADEATNAAKIKQISEGKTQAQISDQAKYIASMKELSRISEQQTSLDTRRADAQKDLATAQSNLALSGAAGATAALNKQNAVLQEQRGIYAANTKSVIDFTYAQTQMARGIGAVAGSLTGLLAVLGGGWGVALTVAGGALAYFMAEQRKVEEQTRKNIKAYEDYQAALNKKTDVKSSPLDESDARKVSLLAEKDVEEADKRLKEHIASQRNLSGTVAAGRATGTETGLSADQIADLERANTLIKDFDGNAEKLNAKIAEMRNQGMPVGQFTDGLEKMSRSAEGAGRALKLAREAVTRLSQSRFDYGSELATLSALQKEYDDYNKETAQQVEISKLNADGKEKEASSLKAWFEAIAGGSRVTRDMAMARGAQLDSIKQVGEAYKDLAKQAEEAYLAEYKASMDAAATYDAWVEHRNKMQIGALRVDDKNDDIEKAQKLQARAWEIFTARKPGSNMTFDDATQMAREEAGLEAKVKLQKQIKDAYDDIKKAAADAFLVEYQAMMDSAKAFDGWIAHRNKMQIQQLKAQGREVEAKTWELMTGTQPGGKQMTYEEAKRQAQEDKASDDRLKAAEKSKRNLEAIQEKIDRMGEEREGAFLGDTDRSVLKDMRSMKFPAEDIQKFREAATSGDYSGITGLMKELRDSEITKKAGESAREVIKEYGNWDQASKMLTEKQQILGEAVKNNAINAWQAKVAYADYLSTFGKMKWIGQTADAFGKFGEDLLFAKLQGKDLNEVLKNLNETIQKIIIQEAVGAPIRALIKGAIGGGAEAAGGGAGMMGILGSLSTAFGNMFGLNPVGTVSKNHTGGTYTGGRVGSIAGFSGAPRYHDGLATNEFRAILQKGEQVMTGQMTRRTAGVIAGLSGMKMGAGGGGGVQVNIENHGPSEPQVSQRSDGSIDVLIPGLESKLNQRAVQGQGIGKSISAVSSKQNLRG